MKPTKLFRDEVYDRLSVSSTPHQKERRKETYGLRKMNETLLTIFNDSDLKRTVQSYGYPIRFAHGPGTSESSRLSNLILDPNEWMMACWYRKADSDAPYTHSFSEYKVFERDGKLGYITDDCYEIYETKPEIKSRPETRVLAKDMIKIFTPRGVLDDLEKTILRIIGRIK